MLNSMSNLSDSHLGSNLKNQSTLKPQVKKSVKNLAATLVLTSLVDAFSILVIFLLLNQASSDQALKMKHADLPSAQQLATLSEGLVVRFDRGQMFVDEAETQENSLTQTLTKTRETYKQKFNKELNVLIIQASKDTDYNKINPVILAGSETGFTEFHFSAFPKSGSSIK